MLLRAITHKDWPAIMDIQAECYHAFEPELLIVMQSKWQISPNTCLVIELNRKVVGYCLAHPWSADNPPTLNQKISHKVTDANYLYIHDIALSSSARGLGAAKKLISELKSKATMTNLKGLSLVAVQGAEQYWLRQGFIITTTSKPILGYCGSAKYMTLIIKQTKLE